MQALSRLAIQTLEFILTLLLLKLTAKPNYRFRNFFRDNELCSKRNWIFASAFGVGFLLSLVFLTSLLAERVIGPKVSMANFCLWPTFAFPIEFFKIASDRLVIALFGLYQNCKVLGLQGLAPFIDHNIECINHFFSCFYFYHIKTIFIIVNIWKFIKHRFSWDLQILWTFFYNSEVWFRVHKITVPFDCRL